MTPKELLSEFETKVRSVNVKDFGDFKRKTHLYLLRLEENLGAAQRQFSADFKEIKQYLTFDPNWKLEDTRRKLLNHVQRLKKML